MSSKQEAGGIPKEISPRIDLEINMAGFSDEFEGLVRDQDDMNYQAVLNKTLQMGYLLFAAHDDESFVIRDKAGFEEQIDIMDERFTYDREATVKNEDGELTGKSQGIYYTGNIRESSMNRANALHIDLEEVAARLVMSGMYVLQQVKEGSFLVKVNNGKREFINTSYEQPKKQVKKRLYDYYESEVAKWQNEEGAQSQ